MGQFTPKVRILNTYTLQADILVALGRDYLYYVTNFYKLKSPLRPMGQSMSKLRILHISTLQAYSWSRSEGININT